MTILNYVSGIIKSNFFASGVYFPSGSEVEIFKVKKDSDVFLKIFNVHTYDSILTPYLGIDETMLIQ